MWVPDVYQGSPTIVTFFFSLAPKLGFVCILIRIILTFSVVLQHLFSSLFLICGIFSLLLGSFAVLNQIKIKRLLAYSSINNVGFFIIILFSNNVESLAIGCLFFFIYIFILTNIFISLLGFSYYHNNMRIKNIFEFFGIMKFNPFFGIVLMTSLFSLLGLPPFAGFFTKFFLFLNIFELQFFVYLFICFISSSISAFIYLKLIRLLFFNKYSNILFFIPFSLHLVILIIINFLINILFFKHSDLFFQIFINSIIDNLLLIN